jgi:serine/threonine protein kinase, bacterial
MQLIELRGYRIIRPLGQGGFGKTYLVEDIHSSTFQQYVFKQFSPQCTDPESYKIAQERFQREAAVLLDLSSKHSQIPKLYSYSFHEQDFYLILEYIEGPSLYEQWRQAGEISEPALRQILIEILDTLSLIHAEKIIHRDVKPENIIIRSSDQKPVLIDFGAVKESVNTRFSSQISGASIAIGSPGFMPPEQAAGRPTYASDLYSLGMTAIYLLTGKRPQELETDSRSHELIWQASTPQISPDFAAVLTKAVKFNPGDRYASAQAMQQALGVGRLGLSPSRPVPSATATLAVAPVVPQPSAKPKAHPLVWVGMAVLGGIVGMGGVLGLVGFYLFSQFAQPRSNTALATAQNAKNQGQFEDCLIALSRLPMNTELPAEAKALQAECQTGVNQQRTVQSSSEVAPRSNQPGSSTQTDNPADGSISTDTPADGSISTDTPDNQQQAQVAQPPDNDPNALDATPPNSSAISEETAISTVEELYAQLSSKNYAAARDIYGPQLADTFEPTFFDQFTRVTVNNLSITSRTNRSIKLVGDNTYVWPDGSTQQEQRSFTVREVDGRPVITASKFVRLVYSRQQGT